MIIGKCGLVISPVPVVQTIFRKLRDRLFIPIGIDYVAQPMSGSGKGSAEFIAGTGIINFPAHIAGNEAVILAVNQQDGDICMPYRFHGAGFPQIKMSEQFGTQPDKRHGQRGR